MCFLNYTFIQFCTVQILVNIRFETSTIICIVQARYFKTNVNGYESSKSVENVTLLLSKNEYSSERVNN